MLRHRVNGVRNAYFLLLFVVFSGIFWGYLYLLGVILKEPDKYEYGRYLMYYIAGIIGFAWLPLTAPKFSERLLMKDLSTCHHVALSFSFFSCVSILVFLVANKDAAISRMYFFSFAPLLYIGLFLTQRCVSLSLGTYLFGRQQAQKTIIVGSIGKARHIESWVNRMSVFGLGIRGYVHADGADEDEEDDVPLNFPKLGPVSALEGVLRHERVSQVLLLELPRNPSILEQVLSATNNVGVRLLVVNNLEEHFGQPVSYFQQYGMHFISLREEPLEDPVHRVMKRLVDIVVSVLVVLLILPPLAIIVAFLHKYQSPGPLFYRQTRSGKEGKPFRIFKFRTMHQTRENSAKQATVNDGRIFTAGKFLRKSSLDELPQFINVLLGHMSVVGPRPHMILHDLRFSREMSAYKVRGFVKPGITGLAQVNGFRGEIRTSADIIQRASFDIRYIESWSIWMDIRIILTTARQVFLPPASAH